MGVKMHIQYGVSDFLTVYFLKFVQYMLSCKITKDVDCTMCASSWIEKKRNPEDLW